MAGFVIKSKVAVAGTTKLLLAKSTAANVMSASGFASIHATTLATITAGLVVGVIAADIADKLATLVATKQMSEDNARKMMEKATQLDEKDQRKMQKDIDNLVKKWVE
ncbi:SAM-like present in kinase suppressor RAS 1 domain-containing protein [Purpureocillium lilacinum]|uniref:SAM-like present in kinase suppressor RAS 1 n=1 Tax=Purpureocillium lilacinum TaxID=33203 RepID=A0A179H8U5_PURLI|nr:SAM-like present in kinase suppressor RAS 1 domain-containing protein [Purpureocillium lilacinum]OAQ85961.1 SAM-like present in kinase suppressor RAS 1 [Purpureocillium lilacinum]OAQ93920.1 SAM-like present in kinase suppressor RAS 1 domain-containing protein [Purpureocillium lilacinum]